MIRLRVNTVDYTDPENLSVSTTTAQAAQWTLNGARVDEDDNGLPVLHIMPNLGDGLEYALSEEAYETTAEIGPTWKLGLNLGTGLDFDANGAVYVTAVGGATTLDGLSDVVITSAASGHLLRNNGTSWVNTTLVEGDIPSLSTSKLTSGTLAVERGGTGIASFTIGNYMRASGATTLEQRTAAQVRTDIGANNASNLTSGTVSVARGGTGLASYAAGNMLYASGATTLVSLTIGAVNTVLTSSGAAPQWSSTLALSGLDIGSVGSLAAAELRVGGDARFSGTVYAANFSLTAGSGSGTGLELNHLDDVVISSPASGQVLRYSGAAWLNSAIQMSDLGTGTTSASTVLHGDGTWSSASVAALNEGVSLTTAATSFNFVGSGVNATESGGAVTVTVTGAVASVFGRTGAIVATEGDYSLTLLSDVTLTAPTSGHLLRYNGTAWVNTTLAAADIPNLSASVITSGTLAVARGGTGIGSYTNDNYLRASGATTLEQRTPAQVRTDIGADNATNLTSGTLASARLAGSYTGITAIGTLTSLTVTSLVTTPMVTNAGTLTMRTTGANALLLQTNSTTRVTVSGSSGAVTFTGALSGISTLAMTGALTGATTLAASTSVTTPLLTQAGTLTLRTTGASSLLLQTNSTTRLTISSAGDFTFVNSVLTGLNSVTASQQMQALYFQAVQSGWTTRMSSNVTGSYVDAMGATNSLRVLVDSVTQLTVDGTGMTAVGTITAPNFALGSDRRLKKDIVAVKDALAVVRQLEPVEYTLRTKPGRRHTGFIAQDIRKLLPHVVYGDDKQMFSIAYMQLVPLLAAAIAELADIVEKHV